MTHVWKDGFVIGKRNKRRSFAGIVYSGDYSSPGLPNRIGIEKHLIVPTGQ
jgi:hypothetical protein